MLGPSVQTENPRLGGENLAVKRAIRGFFFVWGGGGGGQRGRSASLVLFWLLMQFPGNDWLDSAPRGLTYRFSGMICPPRPANRIGRRVFPGLPVLKFFFFSSLFQKIAAPRRFFFLVVRGIFR